MDRPTRISMFGSRKTNLALIFPFVGLILAQQPVQRQPNRPQSIDSFVSSLTAIQSGSFLAASEISAKPEVTLVVNATDHDSDSAPQFALKDVNGRTVRLSDYKGRVVLINFWATWCPPCRAEMPELVRLQREHGKEGLQIIGITYPPEQKARVRRFARSLKVNYPIILGTREFKARFSSEETLPLTVVIDRDGNVSDIISGILLREEFDEKIKPLLIKEN